MAFLAADAFNAKGRTKDATAELDALIATQKLVPADAMFSLNSLFAVVTFRETRLQDFLSNLENVARTTGQTTIRSCLDEC